MTNIFKKTTAVLLSGVLALGGLGLRADALRYSGTESYMSGKYYRQLQEMALTGDPRTDIVNIARSQLGYQEGGSPNQLSGQVYGGVNHTEYGAWYGMQDMWCAIFVSWCANLAGVSTDVIPKHCFTPDGLQWFASRGQAYSREEVQSGAYTPRPGDLVYFKSSRNARSTNHVGMVTAYNKNRLYTIEGNVSSAGVLTNGGAVVSKSYPITNTYIVYICSPDYETVATNVPAHSEEARLRLRNDLVVRESGGILGYDAITDQGGMALGIGQWYGADALDLLRRIRLADEAAFNRLDTACVGAALDEGHLPEGEDACLRAILASRAGVRVQEEKLDEALSAYMKQAQLLGVTDHGAQLLCAAMGHMGGSGIIGRCIDRAGEDVSVTGLLHALEQENPRLYRSCRSLNI